MNLAIIIGKLGADPEKRYTQGGQAVTNFNVATNESWVKDGQKQERTEWHKIVVWGAQAENCEKYLSKGSEVAVRGALQTRDWQDKDGNKRYTTEIKALNVEFIGGKPQGERAGNSPGAGNSHGRQNQNQNNQGFDQSFNDDDIPF